MNEDWNEYRILVLKELERLDEGVKERVKCQAICSKEVDKRLDGIERKIAVLQTKIAVWSAAVGTVAGAGVSALIKYFTGA